MLLKVSKDDRMWNVIFRIIIIIIIIVGVVVVVIVII